MEDPNQPQYSNGSKETAQSSLPFQQVGNKNAAIGESLAYLKSVKETLGAQSEEYREFVDLLKDYKTHRLCRNFLVLEDNGNYEFTYDFVAGKNKMDSYQLMNEIVVSISFCRIGITAVVPRVKVLLKDHQELIVGFNTFFLPAGYRIPDSAPLSPKSKLMDAWRFVTKIERELLHETGRYYSFLKIMKELQEKTKTMAEVHLEMCILFQDKPDLLDEFCSYLPDA
ncbi:hypothetical protein RJ640_005314 [Escallonia rubra]|uniref:Uncharacterized protein n=1 Tax=Escallonia rubra TaxID=112253 RepID=A0AA88QI81_9ASTE|nr:hypothetical protein RJ640_005314 [Escallonia rubra]